MQLMLHGSPTEEGRDFKVSCELDRRKQVDRNLLEALARKHNLMGVLKQLLDSYIVTQDIMFVSYIIVILVSVYTLQIHA